MAEVEGGRQGSRLRGRNAQKQETAVKSRTQE